MKIKKNTLIYKAYRLANENSESDQTNLCTLMTDVCFWAPIFCFCFCLVNLVGLFIGWRPNSFNPFNEKFYSLTDYEGWKVGSYEIYPWLPTLIILFVGLNIFLAIHTLIGLAVVDGSILIGLMMALFINRKVEKPNESLLGVWVQSKKQKVCPIIDFTEE